MCPSVCRDSSVYVYTVDYVADAGTGAYTVKYYADTGTAGYCKDECCALAVAGASVYVGNTDAPARSKADGESPPGAGI